MTRKEAFEQLYLMNKYPEKYKDVIFPIFEVVYNAVYHKMIEDKLDIYILEPDVIINYICQEHFNNMVPLKEEQREEMLKNESYVNRLITIVIDKIYINEFKGYEIPKLINPYNPLITTYQFFLNFILNRFDNIPKTNNIEDAILLDILKKSFTISKGVVSLVADGFETEAFSTWRTVHEVECIAKILFDNPNVTSTYIRHIEYGRYYRNDESDNEFKEALFNEVKGKLKEKNLKSKDTKKYIEYGWLYSLDNVEEKYPDLKLNFRKGVQIVAGLSKYSKIYEMSSEIAHSSPLLIYSNKDYFKSLALICLYDSFFRLEEILYQYLLRNPGINSSSYFAMRKDYLVEMKKNISIENVSFHLKYQNM